jgi:hypothetical protein
MSLPCKLARTGIRPIVDQNTRASVLTRSRI